MNSAKRSRGQVSIEYILMLGAVLMVVALAMVFLQSSILAPQTKTMQNQSDQIKGFKDQLKQQTGQATAPSPTPAGFLPVPPA